MRRARRRSTTRSCGWISGGKFTEAEPLAKKAIEENTRVHGPDRPETAESLNNLAAIYKRQARYDEAETLHQRALALCEKALGPDHASTLQVRENLATVRSDQANRKAAK